ncbi:MAG: DUF2497 domain-containing protein [Alphaproteobacteria bacterium]|nr:DUF2497 domain-containing protein [Alphaproteobacteria bacterium]
MNEPRTQQEPSMEEILASIRRIISEDAEKEDGDIDVEAAPEDKAADTAGGEAESTSAAAPEPEPVPEPGPALQPEPEPEPEPVEEEVLELTNVVEEAMPEPAPEPEPAARAQAAPRPAFGPRDSDRDTDRLVSDETADETREAFARLLRESAAEEPAPDRTRYMGDGSQTIEEVVRSELRPLLRDWLDRHLRSVVEEIVRREVEHIVRDLGRR